MAEGPRLLVVDDIDDNRYTLTRRLNRQGYENIAEAANGREALDALRAGSFDLVLLDVMMPEMNGYETLERIKTDPSMRDIPVIMISALDDMDSVIKCIKLGAEDYLPKPFNATLLQARVGASLEKKRMRDQEADHMSRLESERKRSDKLLNAILPAGAVHVAECTSDDAAIGLHVYGGNVLGLERKMWDPDTLAEQPLDWSKYEALAQRASAADRAPLA